MWVHVAISRRFAPCRAALLTAVREFRVASGEPFLRYAKFIPHSVHPHVFRHARKSPGRSSDQEYRNKDEDDTQSYQEQGSGLIVSHAGEEVSLFRSAVRPENAFSRYSAPALFLFIPTFTLPKPARLRPSKQ